MIDKFRDAIRAFGARIVRIDERIGGVILDTEPAVEALKHYSPTSRIISFSLFFANFRNGILIETIAADNSANKHDDASSNHDGGSETGIDAKNRHQEDHGAFVSADATRVSMTAPMTLAIASAIIICGRISMCPMLMPTNQ